MNRLTASTLTVVIYLILNQSQAQSQNIDTLVDVGGYQLHFNIIEGTGTPILFEAGGGEDATTWKNIISTISEVTQTTLITYDRAGFGKSTFDTTRHGILNGLIGLEMGLTKLGYAGNIILVAHSQGGLYATLYASRHPDKVKGVVFIDATTSCFYGEKRLMETQRSINQQGDKFKKSNPGVYYQGVDFSSNVNYVRNLVFPSNIPAIDFVADYPPLEKKDTSDWKTCHRQFASMEPNRKGITAYGCGHFIFNDNPSMIINAIADMFASTLDNANNNDLLTRSLNYAVNAANSRNKEELAYRHSVDDLNSWAYILMDKGDLKKALLVFKLNTQLNADVWYIYNGYGDALLKNGQKAEAVKMYQKSMVLHPNANEAKEKLDKLSKRGN